MRSPLKRNVRRYYVSMRFSTTLVTILLFCLFVGCRDHSVGQIKVDGDSTPRFSFVGSNVDGLVVYRVPPQYLSKGIPLDETRKEGPNTLWMLDGSHNAAEPIIYGVVPVGVKAMVSAKPLEEGVVYFVSGYVSTPDTGAFVGQYFIINNGHTQEFHGEGGENPNQ